MKAAVVTEAGATPVCANFPEPEAAEGATTYDLVGAGIHQIVRSLAAGRHYGSTGTYPQVAGVDAVGRRPDGALVYTGFTRAPWGTMAERLATPMGFELPAGADPLAVAAGTNPGMSGYLPLRARKAELGELGTVLVLGATGMSGRMAVQAALHLGAQRVVGAGRDAARLEQVASYGAVPVALGDDPAAAIRTGLDGHAPDLVLDFVWGAIAEAAFDALGRTGLAEDDADITYTQIGALAGPNAAVPSTLLRSRRIRIVGSGAGSATRETLATGLPEVIGLIGSGVLQVPHRAYPLSEVGRAWTHGGDERAVVVPG
ncbi:quinone oxidoreductase family protein [Flexivirga caeni]|uniref:Zinc-binding alcohol dehydrogenase family protein n=1 Tax=Flexivirga caeni TaxID=2294115 RepID=A0A3M9M0F6_9MICO|nr:zinc-binding alcohol dehydrogenase family protein [Flexivirga caeni]RNI19039.1 zinc-binding alcohol dehydrogenase family protein [Flexivirga caeni]